MPTPENEITRSNPGPPEPVAAALRALRESAADGDALLVGRCVAELAMGIRPRSFRARVTLPRDEILAIAPTAVPGPSARNTTLLPTRAGPIVIESAGSDTASASGVGFRIEGLRWSSRFATVSGSRKAFEDLDRRRLVLEPSSDRDEWSPLVSLRGACWIAESGFEAAPETAALLASTDATTAAVSPNERTHARQRLKRILLTPDCRDSLAFLSACRFEPFVSAGVGASAAARTAATEPRLRARLASLLIGAKPRNLLRALHFGAELADEVSRLLAWHPIDEHAPSPKIRGSAFRRFIKRAPDELVADAISIRRGQTQAMSSTEPEPGSTLDPNPEREGNAILQRLNQLEVAFDEARVAQSRQTVRLALNGTAVMKYLDLPPGRDVGRAIAHLTAVVERDSSQNTPEALSNVLDQWVAQDGLATGEASSATPASGREVARSDRERDNEA